MQNIGPIAQQRAKFIRSGAERSSQPENTHSFKPVQAAQAYTCPVCHDDGFTRLDVPWGHPQFGKAIECICKAARPQSQVFSWPGVDREQVAELENLMFETFHARYQSKTGDAIDFTDAYQKALSYAKQAKVQAKGQQNVLFAGAFGVGKTHLACAILNELRSTGISCLFTTAIEFFDALYAASFDEKQRLIDRAASTSVLCLDDLDKLHVKPTVDAKSEEPGSYQKSVLFDLLNRRDRAKLPTIITTNKTDDLKQWLHGSVISRLFSNVLAIGMKGPDYRLVGKQK